MLSTIPWAQDLKAASDAFADLPCVSDGVRELTFAALGAKAAALGTELRAAGVKPGEPVATCLRNGIPAVWTSYAVKLVGAAETGLNPALGAEEKRYFIKLAGVRRVVTSAAEAEFFRALGCAVSTVDAVPECGAPLAGFAPVPGEAWGAHQLHLRHHRPVQGDRDLARAALARPPALARKPRLHAEARQPDSPDDALHARRRAPRLLLSRSRRCGDAPRRRRHSSGRAHPRERRRRPHLRPPDRARQAHQRPSRAAASRASARSSAAPHPYHPPSIAGRARSSGRSCG